MKRRVIRAVYASAVACFALWLAGEAVGASGDLDESFEYGGPSFSAREAIFRDNGRILLVGQGYCRSPAYRVKLMAVQIKANGELDSEFGSGGVFCEASPEYTLTAFSDAALDREGRLLLSGKRDEDGGPVDSLVLRLTRTGHLDRTFAQRGKLLLDFGDHERAASILPDGARHFLIGVNATVYETRSDRYKLVRIGDDGQLDSGFDGNGVMDSPHWVDNLHRLRTGKILAFSDPPFRMTEDLRLDRSYGRAGFGDRLPNNLLGGDDAVTSNGGLVWTGETFNSPGIQIAVVMWRRDGKLRESFGEEGVVRTGLGDSDPNPSSNMAPRAAAGGIAVQEDGGLVVTADAYFYDDPMCSEFGSGWRPVVLRYDSDGELDASFGEGGVVRPPLCPQVRSNEVRGIGIDPRNGNIIAQAAGTLVRVFP